jgi:excisionase family DNA binding protein
MTDGLRNVEEAALWLGIPKKTLQNLVTARQVPFTRPAKTRHIRFSQAHLDAIVAMGEHLPMDASPLAARRLGVAETHPPAGPSTPPPPSGPKAKNERVA